MKLHGRWCGWPFVLLCAMLLACGGGEESDGDVSAKDADSGLPEERTYAGFSSEGGEWTFLLEPAAWSLTFSKGNDAPMTRHYDLEDKAPLKFFLRVKDQGGELFGWEKPGRFLLHAFPLGTDKPSMFAAIGETAPAAPALVAGSYLWLEAGAAGDAGTPTFPAWGILTLSAEGAWSRWSFGTPAAEGGGIAPDSYTDAWPPASSPEAVGAWTQVAGTGKITLADGKTQLPGRVWTEEGTAVLVLQTESGMIVGVRAPEQPYVNSDLVKSVPGETDGMHAVVGVWTTGVRWVARGSLPGSQDKSFFYYRIPGVFETQDWLVSQERCGALPNAFSLKLEQGAYTDPPGDWKVYVFAAGSLATVWMIVDPVDGILGVAVGLRQDSADFEAYICDGQLCP